MDVDIEYLKKKIIYRSNYRGTKEMDKLLGAFTNKYINQLNNEDLIDLQKLLDIEDEVQRDTKLTYIISARRTDALFKVGKINE